MSELEYRLRVVYTRQDGGVSVIHPFPSGVDSLVQGGALPTSVWYRPAFRKWAQRTFQITPAVWLAWEQDGAPLVIMQLWEVSKRVSSPQWRSDLAQDDRVALASRYAAALAYGGLNEREAVELISEVDRQPHAKAVEIVDLAEIPTDRTNRNHWRRSSNGGPIWVDA